MFYGQILAYVNIQSSTIGNKLKGRLHNGLANNRRGDYLNVSIKMLTRPVDLLVMLTLSIVLLLHDILDSL